MKFNISLIFVICFFKFSFQLSGKVWRIKPKGFRIQASDCYFEDSDLCFLRSSTFDTKLRRLSDTPCVSELKNPESFDRISYVVFNVNINKTMESTEPAEFIATIKGDNERWTYDNVNVIVDAGTKIYYRIDEFYETDYRCPNTTKFYKNLPKMELITSNTSEIDIAQPTKEKCVEVCEHLDNCERSVTTVQRRPVCKGELIFEEHFNNFDSNKWKIENRIPSDHEDSPFVTFQNSVLVKGKGKLHIEPSYLWRTSGFNASTLRTGTLHVENCTGAPKECFKKAQLSQILPPIISGKIQTKESFSFRYGKVVIRAKMPEGDWVVPQLLLEPLENYYGSTEYMSGQMRVASLRGNRFLQTLEGNDISNKMITGGVVLENRGKMHDVNLRHYYLSEPVSADFHNFTLTWTEQNITVEIDEQPYGVINGDFSKMYDGQYLKNRNVWKNGHFMAPFDREFFISIALSVGGHADFPDDCMTQNNLKSKPWRNDDPKALWNFWKDRHDWMPTWIPVKKTLQVDFVLVYAL